MKGVAQSVHERRNKDEAGKMGLDRGRRTKLRSQTTGAKTKGAKTNRDAAHDTASGQADLRPTPASGSASSSSVVKAQDLCVTFATGDGNVCALDHVDLTVERGEFVTFIGPSGCGKTTFLRAVADLEPLSSGKLAVTGVTPDQARYNRSYGYVFQAPALLPWRTVERNISLPLEIMGFDRDAVSAAVARNLSLVRLEGFERKFPWQLSGGMQQRVSIARALAFDPDLLLMDEPFGALDEIVRDHLNAQLLELWQATRKTILFVTHSISEAVFLSTHIVVMSPRPGKIVEVIQSDLPLERPQTIREDKAFLDIAHRVREGLRAGHVDPVSS